MYIVNKYRQLMGIFKLNYKNTVMAMDFLKDLEKVATEITELRKENEEMKIARITGKAGGKYDTTDRSK